MPHKTAYQMGMEAVLNNPQTSFLNNPKTFSEIHKQSGMSVTGMMKHLGVQSQKQKRQPKPPTDAEKSAERLKQMEAAQNK
jgi:hypothetical protein